MNEIKLSAETLDVLNYFQKIGQMVKIKANCDWIAIVGGETIGVASITETFPRDVNIFDLNEIMSIFNVVKEPTLDLSEENIIYIKTDDLTLRYIEGEGSYIKTTESKPLLQNLPSVDVELDLTLDNIKKMNSLVNTMKLPYVSFESEDGNIYFKGFSKNADSDNNEMNHCKILIKENDSSFENFSFVISRDALACLTADCTVHLSKHFISMFDFGNKQVFISANKTLSKFDAYVID